MQIIVKIMFEKISRFASDLTANLLLKIFWNKFEYESWRGILENVRKFCSWKILLVDTNLPSWPFYFGIISVPNGDSP